MKELRPQLWS
jgi:hypothetical protein